MQPLHSQNQNGIHISNLPYYNFGKGLGLTSPDSIFQFNIRFRIQNRFTYIKNDDVSPSFAGQVRRLRLRFDGFVGNPHFLYVIQLSFASADVGLLEDGADLNIIRDAIVYYKFNSNFNIGFGQTKLPGNRQRVNSSGALQLSDRSNNNARFNIDRDFGFFFNWLNEKESKFSWNLKSAISNGEGRNYTKNPDNGLAYTTKLEMMPLGRFTKDGMYFEGDLIREKTPKVMVSAAYQYNHKAKRLSGVLGDDLYDKKNLTSLLLDAILKYNGYSFMFSYMNRTTNNPVSISQNGLKNYVYVGDGLDFQSSYIFKNNWEIIGRYSVTNPSFKTQEIFPNLNHYTLGLTKYIWEHTFKIQFEASLEKQAYFNSLTKNNFYSRIQVEMGI